MDVLCAEGSFQIAMKLAFRTREAAGVAAQPGLSIRDLSVFLDSISDDSIDECVIVCWQGNDLNKGHQKKDAARVLAKSLGDTISYSHGMVANMPKATNVARHLLRRCLGKYRRPAYIPPAKCSVWSIDPRTEWDRISRQSADMLEDFGIPVFDCSEVFAGWGKRDSWHFAAGTFTARKFAKLLVSIARVARNLDWRRSFTKPVAEAGAGRAPQL